MPLRRVNQEVERAAAAVEALLADASDPINTVDEARADQLRGRLAEAEQTLAERRSALEASYRDIASRRAALAKAEAEGRLDDLLGLESALAASLQQLAQRSAAESTAIRDVRAEHRTLVDALGTATAYGHLDPRAPVALLPVRLETRYFALDEDHFELRVRILPDAVHLDQHQPLLTDAERVAAGEYWQARLEHGPDAEPTALAWHALCERFGESRALFLAASLDPYGRGGRFQPGDDASNAPPIPAPETAPPGWLEPVRARALPDRWAIVGYRGEHRVLLHWTRPVTPELRLTPAPGPPGNELAEPVDELPFDSGIRWLTDFDSAEAAGMGARIRVHKTIARSLERLLVFGVRAASRGDQSPEELDALLRAHVGAGLDFVRPGSPTNNFEDLRSEYRSRRHEHGASHDRLAHANPGSEATSALARLAGALAADPTALRYCWHADESSERVVSALHEALWPATWRRVLRDHVEITVSPEAEALGRALFRDHVRGLGSLPTLRVDNQPYGVLAISALDRLAESVTTTRQRVLVNLLRSLRDYLRRGIETVPTLPAARDLHRALMNILALSPESHLVRGLFIEYVGDEPAEHAARARAWWQAVLAALETGAVDAMAEHGGTTLRQRRAGHRSFGFGYLRPLVSNQDDRRQPLVNNYLAALAAGATHDEVRDHRLPGAAEHSLLYTLLRSARLALDEDGEVAELAAFASHMAALQDLPVNLLDRVSNELVDVCTHRFDAWVVALANQLLASTRAAGHQGLQLGGYGWSEGLEPPGEGVIEAAAPQEDAESAGFVHLPSLDQARTAAILYGGHLAHADRAAAETLSIDLSSDRVRMARWLLDGLRQGQPLGALLGYRFERALQGATLAEHIPRLRRLAPLQVGETSVGGSELANANVVDGLALLQQWKAGTLDEALNDGALFGALQAPLRMLDDAVDATSDLLLAEGVHQATMGNPATAAAAFDAMAEGSSFPAEPQVVATPATGVQIAHRLAVLLPAEPGPGWPGDQQRPRAIAEPRLNAWAARLLGLPANIRFRSLAFFAGQDQPKVQEHSLADVDLSPLDVVFMAGPRLDCPLTELITLRMKWEAASGAQSPESHNADSTPIKLTLDPTRQTSFPAQAISLEETLALAHALQRLLADSTPLDDSHLLPGTGNPPSLGDDDLAELQARAGNLHDRVAAIADGYAANPEHLEAWWHATLLAGPVDPTLADAVSGLSSTLAQRLADAVAVSDEDPARAAGQRIAALLTKAFKTLPLFRPTARGALATGFAHKDALLQGDATRFTRWLHDYARVRPACEALDLVVTLSEALGQPPRLDAAQFPVVPGQPWIGEQLPESGPLPRLSLVALNPLTLAGFDRLAGLAVDRWSEVISEPRRSTGLAFHYDAPKAQAPQVLLLAVPPDPQASDWRFEDLESTLLETLELAKLRGIAPEDLIDDDSPVGHLGFYRPALLLPGDHRPDLEDPAEG